MCIDQFMEMRAGSPEVKQKLELGEECVTSGDSPGLILARQTNFICRNTEMEDAAKDMTDPWSSNPLFLQEFGGTYKNPFHRVMLLFNSLILHGISLSTTTCLQC